MPQKGSPDLFHLIKSLDRTEKAYFKKFAERHVIGDRNNYVKLFNAIDKQVVYDEAKILREEKYIKQLPYLKNYLFDLILKSMNVYHAEASPENEVENALLQIRVLYKKKLFDPCLKLIARTKQECIKYELFLDLLKLIGIEGNILNESDKRHDNKKLSDAIKRDAMHYQECYRVTMLYHELENELLYKAWEVDKKRRLHKAEDFASIMSNELLLDEKRATSLRARMQFHNIHLLYTFYVWDAEQHFYHAKKLKEAHQERFVLFKDVLKYILCLNNFYLSCLNTKRVEAGSKVLDEMKSLPVKTLREEEEVFSRYIMFKANTFIVNRDYKKGVAFVKQYMPVYERIEASTKPRRKIKLHQIIGTLHFFNGDFKESLKWINLQITPEAAKVDVEIYYHGLIQNLMVHYELKNEELIPYLVKSAQRFFTGNKVLSAFEKIMLHLFTEITKPGTNKKQLLEQTKNDLEFIFKDSLFDNIPNHIDYVGWVESKMGKVKLSR